MRRSSRSSRSARSPRRRPTARTLAAVVLVAVVVAGGCSDDGSISSTTTPSTTTTPASDTTTTTSGETSTTTTTSEPGHPLRTGGPTVRRDGTPDETGPATLPPDGATAPRDPMAGDFSTWPEYRLARAAADAGTGTRALGSGCSPADPTHLGDGLWYGYVDGLRDGVVSFDLACWWVGDLATVTGCEDQADMDSCVLNTSDRERTVPLALDATFHLPRHFDDPGIDLNVDATFDEFATWLGLPANGLPVWVKVDRGALVEVEADQLLAG